MSGLDPKVLAEEFTAAYKARQPIVIPPSARLAGFTLATGYAVEAELTRLRRASGHRTVGRKVGYANKALWRALKLETLVWAHMYDDTVQYADGNLAARSLSRMTSPKIEPEIVFKLKKPLGDGALDPAAALAAVEWLALGFEIIDCVYSDWRFQPADFVASFGLHAALVIGEPRPIDPQMIPQLVEQLPRFKVTILKNGQHVEEGSGRNSLRSPALCLGELASAIARDPTAEPLAAGELVSSGTLTDSRSIAPGETWTATTEELDLAALTLRTD